MFKVRLHYEVQQNAEILTDQISSALMKVFLKYVSNSIFDLDPLRGAAEDVEAPLQLQEFEFPNTSARPIWLKGTILG